MSAPSFSVFPLSQVPRIAMPNPHNRKPSLSKDIVSTTEIRAVKLEENPVPKIPPRHLSAVQKDRASPGPPLPLPPPPPRPSSRRNTANGVRSPEQIGRVSPNERGNHAPKDHKPAGKRSPEAGSIGSMSTLVRSTTPEGRSKSPVVPVRSMFPVYNPSLPLSEQSYYPQRPAAIHAHVPTSKYSRQDLRAFITSPIDLEVGAKTAPASIADVPLYALQSREAQFSSPRALERLWDATHGTEHNVAIGSFDLEMARTSEATFTFGSDPSKPFYSVATYDTNELVITKTCPRKRTVTCDVALAAIEPMERRFPPADGLVTFIFPKMAAMLAVNQSSALAEEYGLDAAHRDEVQATAIKRAANQEASYLRYNHVENRYELEHPAITRGQKEPNYITLPQTPVELQNAVLHITVNQTAGQTSHGKPSITVTCPSAARSPSVADAGFRLSTMGQSEGNCTLASLDFHSNTLHIDAFRILELMPSLFAIDSLVSAIVSVAIADPTTNVVMGSMDLWYPRPKDPGTPAGSTAMSWGTPSVFYATAAERAEAEAQAKIAQQSSRKRSSSRRTQSSPPSEQRTWFGRKKTTKQKRPKETKKIMIDELDLEKLGHYQGGDRKGQELPAITRTLLGLLVAGLKFVVWILTIFVKLLAWVLVHATRCFTSEKF